MNDSYEKVKIVLGKSQPDLLKWMTILVGVCTVVFAGVIAFSPFGEPPSQLEGAALEESYSTKEMAIRTNAHMDIERPLRDTLFETTDKRAILSTAELQQSLAELKNTVQVAGVRGYSISADTEEAINSAISDIEEQGYEVGFVMVDITTGRGVVYNCEEEFYSASSIKGIYCTGFAANFPDEFAMEEGALYAMISYSDNDSYLGMRSLYSDEAIVLWCEAAGTESLGGDEWFPVCSSKTMTQLWLQNYLYFQTGSEISELVGSWYESTYNSAIDNALGNSHKVRSKGGWIADDDDGLYSTVDAGIVYAGADGERPYLLVIMTDIPNNMNKLVPLVLALDVAHEESWGK